MRVFIIIIALVLSQLSKADVLSESERNKRKLVSRMYQATDAGLIICPSADREEFREILDRFKAEYSVLDGLLNTSQYRSYSVSNFSDDLERIKQENNESRSRQCLFLKDVLGSMLDTDKGREEIKKYIQVLKG